MTPTDVVTRVRRTGWTQALRRRIIFRKARVFTNFRKVSGKPLNFFFLVKAFRKEISGNTFRKTYKPRDFRARDFRRAFFNISLS
jgi:hypothetical protein